MTDEKKAELYQLYAERFDAADLTADEWALLESYFADLVGNLKAGRAERERAVEALTADATD